MNYKKPKYFAHLIDELYPNCETHTKLLKITKTDKGSGKITGKTTRKWGLTDELLSNTL